MSSPRTAGSATKIDVNGNSSKANWRKGKERFDNLTAKFNHYEEHNSLSCLKENTSTVFQQSITM